MGAETAGRKLGIGLRLAAKAAKERAGRTGAVSASPANAQAIPAGVAQASSKAKAIGQGAKRFGEAIWGPMAHIGSVLWLEITGLFFALFAAFFGQSVYKFRGDWNGGPNHAHFLIYAALTALFSIFTISQFYRARQKEKAKRARSAVGR